MSAEHINATIKVFATPLGVQLRAVTHVDESGKAHWISLTLPLPWSYECAQRITMASMQCEEGKFDLP
ncbi:hypothetical protein C6N75_09840 [Streptomyces solincola]|uniref:Uncharacterized protein n=1 Tax=Streptomyces solincola TaxID=2100817 RepID=A0A2S9PY60_9ACTN|nr:hypothetical protein [Streptomyces solincola]PRH79376.1 hypothetical protein C6N75_09840 [Streptomyces solincola]